MMNSCLCWSVLLSIVVSRHSTVLRADDSVHLRVSESGRFLVRQDGSGVFPVADTAWAIAWRLNRGQVWLLHAVVCPFRQAHCASPASQAYRRTSRRDTLCVKACPQKLLEFELHSGKRLPKVVWRCCPRARFVKVAREEHGRTQIERETTAEIVGEHVRQFRAHVI